MSEKREIVFIINPVGNRGKTKKRWASIYKELEQLLDDYKITQKFTQYIGHAQQLSMEATSRGVHVIVAVGGDGSFNEVLQGYMQISMSKPPLTPESYKTSPQSHSFTSLALFPLGTGSDYGRLFSCQPDAQALANSINSGARSLVSVGRVSSQMPDGTCQIRYFANLASSGVSSQAAQLVHRYKRFNANLAYKLAGLHGMVKHKRVTIRVEISDSSDGPVDCPPTSVQNHPSAVIVPLKNAPKKRVGPPLSSQSAVSPSHSTKQKPPRFIDYGNGVVDITSATTVAVGIGRFFGSGLQVCPHAHPTHPATLAITALSDMSMYDFIKHDQKLREGTFVALKRTLLMRGTRVRLSHVAHTSAQPSGGEEMQSRQPKQGQVLSVEVDGENGGTLPCDIEVVDQPVALVVPQGWQIKPWQEL